jgi:hypothetical protein
MPPAIRLTDCSQDGVLGEITQTEDMPKSLAAIFPGDPVSAKPTCGAWPLCSREVKYFFNIIRRATANAK